MNTSLLHNQLEYVTYIVDTNTITTILKRKKPLAKSELDGAYLKETHSLQTEDKLLNNPSKSEFPVPSSVGELIFPQTIESPSGFQACAGIVFCYHLIDDQLRLVMKCKYMSIPFSINS